MRVSEDYFSMVDMRVAAVLTTMRSPLDIVDVGMTVSQIVRLTGLRIGTIRASLKRQLSRDGFGIVRMWDGDARYGRYLYAFLPR